MKKYSKLFFPALFTSAFSMAEAPQQPQAQFISSIQMAVHEKNPQLLMRSQKLVMDEFARNFDTQPMLRGKRFEMRTQGNQVVFYMTTDEDMRVPMHAAVTQLVDHLNGRVYTKGRSAFYKTAFSQPLGGYLEVTFDDTHTKILSMAAQAVPLRDLLKEIKSQVGSFSYLIPGECADKELDWSLGDPERMPDGIPLEVAMSELAQVFGMAVVKRNGTYIFSGACQEMKRSNRQNAANVELLRNSFFPGNSAGLPVAHRQVFVPLLPIGE